MFENCKTYNRPNSKLYRDCVSLQKVMQNRLEELNVDAEIVPPTPATATDAPIAATAAAGIPEDKENNVTVGLEVVINFL